MIFRHMKTGGLYSLLAIAVRESDLEPVAIYSSQETQTTWTRPAREFFDGRFEVHFPKTEIPHQRRLQ